MAAEGESRGARRKTRKLEPYFERRELAEELASRAHLLCREDRELFTAVFEDGRSCEALARIGNISGRTIRRRIERLVERATSPLFVFVCRHRDEWSPTRRRIATMLFLHGRPARDVARELGLSVYNVRYHLYAVLAVFESDDRAA